ncbi:Clp protease N-terminal domain-containing protein, partial [Micromonospora zhanjiangensis]
MLERFTSQARQVVMDARAERRRLRHDFIGTEHLLLALLDERVGAAGEILRGAGLTADGVRAEIERQVGVRPGGL